MKVKHSVAIRVISSLEDLQFVSTRCVLYRLLRICKAYDVVVYIWVSIETGDVGQQFVNARVACYFPVHE